MRIIKLNAIDSTNSYLRKLITAQEIEDNTVVVADYQTHGRGQMGTQWSSQESKNLMVSVFKDVSFLKVERSFFISIATSLAILKGLEMFQINNLKVKWPNDILSDNKKIVGILIENVIKHSQLQASIIGFGVNVNQTEFGDLTKASSLRLLSGNVYDLDEVLNAILLQLTHYFNLLKTGQFKPLKKEYEKCLYRNSKPSTFINEHGGHFSGIIIGISESGNLRVLMEEQHIKEFDLKEIKLLY